MSPDPAIAAAAMKLLHARLKDHDGLFVLGICGAQGSGKSTLAQTLVTQMNGQGVRAAVLSLDDIYLTLAERSQLAREVHPLLATRGVPGSHDVGLGLSLLASMERDERILLPVFDKANDDRASVDRWHPVPAGCRVMVFEGWCLGARPQPEVALGEPANDLERDEDPGGVWRRWVNAQLAGDYQRLFSRIDALIMLAAPSFAVVRDWRWQQERDLEQSSVAVMNETGIARFIQFYQRLTEWMLDEMPAHTDLVVRLDERRWALRIG